MSKIIDQSVRDRAAEEITTSIALTAGAGAGKTSVLVARVKQLLLAGVAPRKIAVITFTDKAAGELRERVRDELETELEHLSGPTASSDPQLDAKAKLEAALDRLSELTTSTIHSFAQSLLFIESFEAAWAPGTEVMAETLSASAVEQAYRAWRDGFDERHPELATKIRDLASESAIRNVAEEFLKFRDLEPVVGDAVVHWEEGKLELFAIKTAALRLRKDCLHPDQCILLKNNATFFAGLDWLEDDTPAEDAVTSAITFATKQIGGRKGDWLNDSHNTLKAELKRFKDEWQKKWKSKINEPYHHALISDLRNEFRALTQHHKRQASQVDFDDLLFSCAHLLEHKPSARARLAARFDAILVDEVQDTDPVQAKIVALLTRDPTHDGDWKEFPPEPGRLFAVGDPKQSIYRFRRADIATWHELETLIKKQGEKLELLQNFRSVPGIVQFANHVFSGLKDYQAIHPHRMDASLDPIVLLRADSPADEAEVMIRHLTELKENRAQVHVKDPTTNTPTLRDMQWRDVMLLIPSWTHAEAIQDAFLAAGIDCVVEGGNEFWKRDEVRLVIAALKAIDEPGESQATVFVLRGFFGGSHEDLARHKAQGGHWRYTITEAQPDGPVKDALAVLSQLHRQRSKSSWLPILEQLIDRTQVAAVWSLTARGRAMLANLDKMRELIRQLEDVCRTPSEVVRRLEQLSRYEKDQDLPVSDSEADAVKITSIFKAKGLEAPIVGLLRADRQARTNSYALIDREKGTVSLKAGDLKPPGWDELVEHEKAQVREEMRRWIYVAATRARDQLVITATEEKSSLLKADLGVMLEKTEDADHDASVDLAPEVTVKVRHGDALPDLEAREETFPGLDAEIDALLAAPPTASDGELDARQTEIEARIKRAAQGCTRWVSVTESVQDGQASTGGGQGVGRLGGTVVHQVMEALDLSQDVSAQEVDVLVECYASLAALDEDVTERCKTIVHRILADPTVARARAAPERWKEVPFAFEDARGVVSGTIDLCFPTDETRTRWVVVDWKSDMPEEGTGLRKKYEAQVKKYAEALIHNLWVVGTAGPIKIDAVLVGPHAELLPEPDPESSPESSSE